MQLLNSRHDAPLVRKLHVPEGQIMNKAITVALGLTLAFGSAAAWAQRPGASVEQPIVRSLNWFSYVAGDDIRAACRPGGRNRIRLVYNALWEEQVRTYEIFLQPDGTAGLHIGVLTDQGAGDQRLEHLHQRIRRRHRAMAHAKSPAAAVAGRDQRADGIAAGERRLRSATRWPAAARTTISGGRLRPAATAYGVFRRTTIRPTVSRMYASPRNCLPSTTLA